MHCGVMVTGYNQGDWERLLKGDYDRPPTVSDAQNMDDTLAMGELVEPLGFDFPIGGFSPPEGRLARGFKPPAFSRFLFQSAVKSAESF